MIGSPFFSFFLESKIILLLVLFRQADKSIYYALSYKIFSFYTSESNGQSARKVVSSFLIVSSGSLAPSSTACDAL